MTHASTVPSGAAAALTAASILAFLAACFGLENPLLANVTVNAILTLGRLDCSGGRRKKRVTKAREELERLEMCTVDDSMDMVVFILTGDVIAHVVAG